MPYKKRVEPYARHGDAGHGDVSPVPLKVGQEKRPRVPRKETPHLKCGFSLQTKLEIGTAMYSQSILIQKLLMALMRLNLETTVCEAWRPSKLSLSRTTFDSVRFFLVEPN